MKREREREGSPTSIGSGYGESDAVVDQVGVEQEQRDICEVVVKGKVLRRLSVTLLQWGGVSATDGVGAWWGLGEDELKTRQMTLGRSVLLRSDSPAGR